MILVLYGCSVNNMPKDLPTDFGFSVKYGIQSRNELNTFNGEFTKDLITSGTATTKLKLTDEEMRQVYGQMRRINIMGYDEIFSPDSFSLTKYFVTPYRTYQFTVSYGGQKKSIIWKDESLSNTASAKDLRDLVQIIQDIIERKEEFKNLPQPTGGYM